MEHLILARHAESVFNARGVLNGDPSEPGGLTDRGRAQARRLGELLAGDTIDLCVTTAFQRTRETADASLDGREIPRLVMTELDDPPNGDFELRPYEELARWREANGPDVAYPGSDRTELQIVTSMLSGVERLLARPETTVFVVAHGWFVAWINGAVVRAAQPRGWNIPQATPIRIERADLERAASELGEDPYRYG